MKGISIASTNLLNGQWLGMFRSMWYVAAFLTILIVVASIPGYIEAIPKGFIQAQFVVNSSPAVIATNILAAICSLAAVFLSLFLAYLSNHVPGQLLPFFTLSRWSLCHTMEPLDCAGSGYHRPDYDSFG